MRAHMTNIAMYAMQVVEARLLQQQHQQVHIYICPLPDMYIKHFQCLAGSDHIMRRLACQAVLARMTMDS